MTDFSFLVKGVSISGSACGLLVACTNLDFSCSGISQLCTFWQFDKYLHWDSSDFRAGRIYFIYKYQVANALIQSHTFIWLESLQFW